ncbi:9201_t:CDS:2, partial [Racocetra persica]
ADPKAGLGSRTQIHREQKKKLVLTINELIKWLLKSEIKNNKKIRSKLVPKTDKEWFDLMESNISEPSNPEPQAYYFLDLDIEVPWPVLFPENEEHHEVWQNSIQYAKDMFKVNGAKYAFSTWFIDTEEYKLEAGMTEDEYLIRVKFIRADTVISDKETKRGFKIIDKYEPICESKKANSKYIKGDPNIILTKKMKPGVWVRIDEKFLVREVIEQSERGHGLTEICQQKINDWEKKMRIPGARVQDVAELEKILKRPIKLLDITHGTIFNSGKYRSGKYEEIGIVVHNGHEAISNALRGPQAIWLMGIGDTSQTISQFVLEDGRTFRIWKKHTEIIEVCKQLINDTIDWQYQKEIINKEKKSILSESLKVVDLAKQVFGANHAGSRLAKEINEWYPIFGKVNENIRQACVKYRHGGRWNVPDYHVNDIVCIDMKECYPAIAVNRELPEDDIAGFAQIRSFKFASNIHSVIPVWYRKHFACRSGEGCGKEKGWAPITKVWLPRNRDISCAIIGKFTQGGKIDEKRLTHRLVTDEGELDFLIKDCTDAGTFAGREKCLLRFILTYYEGHQPQYTHLQASMLAYAHINLLEMLRRFDPNKVVRIATDPIYVRKEALYKIENIPAFFKQVEVKSDDAEHRIGDFPNLCSHYPSCAICTDPEEFFISKSKYAKWIKEFQKTKTPLVKYDCKRHKPFICRFCFTEWFYRPDSYALSHQLEEQEI